MTTTAVKTTTKLRGLLESLGLFSPPQIDEIMVRHKQAGGSITDLIALQGYAKEDVFLETLAKAMGIPFVRVGEMNLSKELLEKIPTKAVFQYNVIPVSVEKGVLRVVTHDPFRSGLMDALKLASGLRVRFSLSPSVELAKASKKFYGVGAETLDQMIADNRIDLDDDSLLKDDLSDLDQEASVVKFVNQIIWEAHQERSTDIHLEPMETDLRIRYRVDGLLRQTPVPPQVKRFQAAIISRIKVMAGMDIADKRMPQDGRINLKIKGEEIDVRVSTVPTVYGESVSLRLLLRSSGALGMDKLGMNLQDETLLRKLITRPHGILLVTGPTGSGKSTSLYAWLQTINSINKRILTVEDPIEYEMAGINQVLVRPEIELTFAKALRHFLRQDPDVIMVGEIRDRETAQIAIQASLTGHLVFSTLHTNDAGSAITRLLDMGIEPFLVASSVEALVAQRLVRRLCKNCRRPRNLDEPFLAEIGFPLDRLGEGTIFEPAGCEQCMTTGFKGRTGIYEILVVNDQIRSLIMSRASASEIKQVAIKNGMRNLRTDGWNKVLEGTTCIEEVIEATEEDEALVALQPEA
ncbi:MAG: GspE/PulE family protein [Lentisphaerota bacterium]